MRNTKKQAFTLVELIVVITILAVLGTIAFMSLQGYSNDARNAKVSSDVNTIAQKINVATTDSAGKVYLPDVLKAGSQDTSKEFTGTTTVGSGAVVLATLTASNQYKVGLIDFITLKENSDDFKDNDGNDYIYAFAAKGQDLLFQIAGKIKNSDGSESSVVAGTFYSNPDTTTDVAGLIKGSSAGAVINGSGANLPY